MVLPLVYWTHFSQPRSNWFYLVGILDTLLASLQQLTAQAEAFIRQQEGPHLTVVDLQQRMDLLS
jgi:hypothetical protein